jgi:autotransporter-associated beta strand protein
MMFRIDKSLFLFFVLAIGLSGCNKTTGYSKFRSFDNEFIVELPQVSYPLPLVDNIANNCNEKEKRSIDDNPVVYILRGINDIWKGTSDAYQKASSKNGPSPSDYVKGNPILDSVVWAENMKYVLDVTQNRTEDEAILAFLDDVRSKYYSVTDGFGPLTEDYVKYSGVYVDLPEITRDQVLYNAHFQSKYNNGNPYAGSESSPLGAVVKLARNFRATCSSTEASKYLFSTPRPWRMNNSGAVKFQGTTYNTKTGKPLYKCVDNTGNVEYKIFDLYESNVKVVPGLMCSRKAHEEIYDENQPSPDRLYTNTTENIGTDNGYPSGHTNAGALVSLAYAYAFPERFTELVFRGAQLGEDRIIAGMHSPVDVIGGKIMALAIACAALNNPEIATEAEKALSATMAVFGAKADSADMSLFEYAHRKVENPTGYTIGDNINTRVFNNNIYDDRARAKQIYREWLTYGFTRDTSKAKELPIVPKGAEAILKSRFPYLTDNQRRLVLYTTGLPSGYKILDKTNGWGRIDLVTAADGFGAFIGDVHVQMDAERGRFNAFDSWGNDITGDGRLIKSGSGKLVLKGNNTYSGGTVIGEGSLSTTSKNALGTGDVTIYGNGTLEVEQPLAMNGGLSLNSGTIRVYVYQKGSPQIVVNKEVNLKNSTLDLNFHPGQQPKPGERIPIIQANSIKGTFKNIIANGFEYTCEKSGNTIYAVMK